MINAEFSGRDSMMEAVEAALTWNYSAVIVTDVITNKALLRDAARRKPHQVSCVPEFLDNIFPMDVLNERLTIWAANNRRPYLGMHGGVRVSRTQPRHIDKDYLSPFAVSVGLRRSATWMTQLANGRQDAWNTWPFARVKFDSQMPIDRFRQNPGDVVLVPGFKNPAIHQIVRQVGRVARVFTPLTVADGRIGKKDFLAEN